MPERQQVVLGGQQARVPVVGRCARHQPGHQGRRALLQAAVGLALVIALDPAVGRIGCRRGDARQLERPAVHPRAVPVPVRQERGPVADHGVEQVFRRHPAGERLHEPAAASDPRHLRVRAGVGRDDRLILHCRLGTGQIAPPQSISGKHRVDVRIDEPGQQRPAVQVDRLGRAELAGVRGRADVADGFAADPDDRAGREEPEAVEDRAAVKQQLRACAARGLQDAPGSNCPRLDHLPDS